MKRKQKTIINIISSVSSQLLVAILALFTTRIIKQKLGFDYLGINGVFTNIISFLNLSELGIGSTVLFALYKPLAENNQMQINSILNFYKKAYRYIALFILITGLGIIPFLNIIIKTELPFYYISLIYIIFLITTVSSYLLSYRFILVNADQKGYILNIYSLVFTYVIKILQILIFVYTNSYILFLLVNLIFSTTKNIFLNIKIKKMYPFSNTKKKVGLSDETKTMLKNKIKAIIFHNFGGYILNGTDNLLIAMLISITSVGKYAGYLSVENLIMGLTNKIFDAITPSIGNFINTESKENQIILFNKFVFVTRIFYMFVPVCLSILMEPFLCLWLGRDTLLPFSTSILIGVYAFFTIMRKPILGFKTAAGIFEQDKYCPIIEAVINIISSIILGKIYGISGIISGTIISLICVPLWVQPIIVIKSFLKKSPISYFIGVLKDSIITIIIFLLLYYIQRFLNFDNVFINFIIKLIVTVTLNIIIIYFLNFKEINKIIKTRFVEKFN